MSASVQNKNQENDPIQCFFRISIGGEILAKDIVVELDTQSYPRTCESFLSLCAGSASNGDDTSSQRGHRGTVSPLRTSRRSPQPTYRGCEFHRVVPGLCVQAGDWERFDGTGGFSPLYGRNWKDEEGTLGGKKYNKHDREGIVSMANAGKPNTNGSQFFVTLKPTPHLDGKHTAFGRVVSGMESVRRMSDVERGEKDRPVSLQRIVIEDCGRVVLEQKGNSSKAKPEQDDSRRSRVKEDKRKRKSRKKERKKREKKRRRNSRYDSSGSDSYSSSDDSLGTDDDSGSRKIEGRRRERRSRKHRKRKRRRKKQEHHDSSDDDESSDSSANDDNSSTGRKYQRRQSSRDEYARRDRKKKDRERKRRKDEKRRSSYTR